MDMAVTDAPEQSTKAKGNLIWIMHVQSSENSATKGVSQIQNFASKTFT